MAGYKMLPQESGLTSLNRYRKHRIFLFFTFLLSRRRKGYSPVLLFAATRHHEIRHPIRPAVPRGRSHRR